MEPIIINRTFQTRVIEKVWGPEDRYLVVPLTDAQVFPSDRIKDGTRVSVSIRMEFK